MIFNIKIIKSKFLFKKKRLTKLNMINNKIIIYMKENKILKPIL